MFHTNIFTIPQGIYTIQDFIDFFNIKCEEYEVTMNLLQNGKIEISCGFNLRYFFKQTTGKDGVATAFNGGALNKWQYGDVKSGKIIGGMKIEIYFSNKLFYILGGDIEDAIEMDLTEYYGTKVYCIQFFSSDNENNSNKILKRDSYEKSKVFSKLPDPFEGINKIYIYCEEVEKSIVGDDLAPLLAIVPLEYKDQGSSELSTFSPALINRRIIKKKIDKLHISLRDYRSQLIHFDSGTVNIECIVI